MCATPNAQPACPTPNPRWSPSSCGGRARVLSRVTSQSLPYVHSVAPVPSIRPQVLPTLREQWPLELCDVAASAYPENRNLKPDEKWPGHTTATSTTHRPPVSNWIEASRARTILSQRTSLLPGPEEKRHARPQGGLPNPSQSPGEHKDGFTGVTPGADKHTGLNFSGHQLDLVIKLQPCRCWS